MSDAVRVGNVHGDGNAFGANARTHVVKSGSSSGLAELVVQLESLRGLLDRHAGQVADVETAAEMADAATEQARSGQPNLKRIVAALAAIAAAAPGVTAVTDAVGRIRDLVASLT